MKTFGADCSLFLEDILLEPILRVTWICCICDVCVNLCILLKPEVLCTPVIAFGVFTSFFRVARTSPKRLRTCSILWGIYKHIIQPLFLGAWSFVDLSLIYDRLIRGQYGIVVMNSLQLNLALILIHSFLALLSW